MSLDWLNSETKNTLGLGNDNLYFELEIYLYNGENYAIVSNMVGQDRHEFYNLMTKVLNRAETEFKIKDVHQMVDNATYKYFEQNIFDRVSHEAIVFSEDYRIIKTNVKDFFEIYTNVMS